MSTRSFYARRGLALRQSELVALQWNDLNLAGRFVEVDRNFTRGRLTTPKSGESRRVDLSRKLTATLRRCSSIDSWKPPLKGATHLHGCSVMRMENRSIRTGPACGSSSF